MIIRVLGEEIEFTAANTVNDSVLVRVFATTANTLVTVSDPVANNVIGSFRMAQNTVEIVEKKTTEILEASASIRCTPVAYRG